jgi:phosphoribosylglycinamide formyltransferase-1
MLKLAVLVSGGGTNLQALIDQIESKKLAGVSIETVISSNKNAYALERARLNGIETAVVSKKDYENMNDFEDAFLRLIDRFQVDLIVLAGFLTSFSICLSSSDITTLGEILIISLLNT